MGEDKGWCVPRHQEPNQRFHDTLKGGGGVVPPFLTGLPIPKAQPQKVELLKGLCEMGLDFLAAGPDIKNY